MHKNETEKKSKRIITSVLKDFVSRKGLIVKLRENYKQLLAMKRRFIDKLQTKMGKVEAM